MIKWESKFHTKLVKWITHHIDVIDGSFETKVVRPGDTRFAFREMTPKEERILLLAKRRGFVQTNSDIAQWGTNCDGAIVKGGGTIFIQWVRPRNKTFYSIDIDDYMSFKKSHHMESMTEDDANLVGLRHELA